MHSFLRHDATIFALVRHLDAHGAHTFVATYTRLKSGSWRVQVRRKGKYVNDTFRRRKDAEEWALDIERRIDRGEPALPCGGRDTKTFGDLIFLHQEDLGEVGKPDRSVEGREPCSTGAPPVHSC